MKTRTLTNNQKEYLMSNIALLEKYRFEYEKYSDEEIKNNMLEYEEIKNNMLELIQNQISDIYIDFVKK